MKRIFAFLLSLGFLFTLSACQPGDEVPTDTAYVLSSPAADTYYCAENGVTYLRQPALYLPMMLARTPYATYTNQHGVRLSFYALSEGCEDRYLMLADPDDLYPYYIIAAADYTMPTLAEMNPYQILICTAEEERFWLAPNVYDQIRTLSVVHKIVTAYENGKEAALPVLGKETARVELIFVSALYPAFSYTCTYYEFEDGSCYFYEMPTGRCVQVEGGLFDGYILVPQA